MYFGSIIKDMKLNEENDWVKWMVKVDCGILRRNFVYKNVSLVRLGLIMNWL